MSLRMNSAERKMAPENEQAICLGCGLCCDGTLFGHAVLGPGEKGNLPDLIEQNVFMLDSNDYFRLPCLYFKEKCTIYGSPRAEVCGSYRCRLLSDMAEGKVSAEEAMEITAKARDFRDSLTRDYSVFRTGNVIVPFTMILRELGKRTKNDNGNVFTDTDYEIMQARCNIFEALLIKYFRPADDFDKMIMK